MYLSQNKFEKFLIILTWYLLPLVKSCHNLMSLNYRYIYCCWQPNYIIQISVNAVCSFLYSIIFLFVYRMTVVGTSCSVITGQHISKPGSTVPCPETIRSTLMKYRQHSFLRMSSWCMLYSIPQCKSLSNDRQIFSSSKCIKEVSWSCLFVCLSGTLGYAVYILYAR